MTIPPDPGRPSVRPPSSMKRPRGRTSPGPDCERAARTGLRWWRRSSHRLGHEVYRAFRIEVNDVGAVTARERPDVALVGSAKSSDHALMLIEKIVQESACPVIVLIHAADPEFVREASKRGIFAYITDGEGTRLAGLHRHRSAPLRRVPRPRGSVRPSGHHRARQGHSHGAPLDRRGGGAFDLLRSPGRVRRTASSSDIAAAVVDGHALLPGQAPEPAD